MLKTLSNIIFIHSYDMTQMVIQEHSDSGMDVEGLQILCSVCEESQQFLPGMIDMQDIEDVAVYVNMIGQNPSFLFFILPKNKFQFYKTVTKFYDVIFLVTKLKKKCKKL